MYWYLLIIYALFGLVIGSFLNVCIWRIPKGLSVAAGRSFCPNCNHELAAKDLIPIISWVLLGGKCRYCKAPVSLRYPLTEALNMILWVIAYLVLGHSVYSVIVCLYTSVLVCLAFTDIDTMEVPSIYLYILIVFGVLAQIFWLRNPTDAILGFLIAGVPLVILYYVSNGAIGGGDVRLMAIAGILLGLNNVIFALLFGYVLASVCMIPSLLRKQADGKTEVPMVPYLSIGIYISILYGTQITQWYLNLL